MGMAVMASPVVSFRFSCRMGGAMAFRLVSRLVGRIVCVGVPLLVLFLVSCCRSVRVSWVSVLVSAFRFVVSALASRFSFRFSPRVVVSCCRASRLAFRCGVSWRRLVVLLVFSSRRSILPSRLVSFLCRARGGCVCCDVVRGSSHVGSILSWASRFVHSSRVSFRPSSCSHFVSSCSCRYRGGDAARVRRGGDVIVIMWSGRRCSPVLVFLIGSAGRGTGLMGMRRFIQLVFSYSQCQV